MPYGKKYAGLGLAVSEQNAGRPCRFRSFLLPEAERIDALAVSARRRAGQGR